MIAVVQFLDYLQVPSKSNAKVELLEHVHDGPVLAHLGEVITFFFQQDFELASSQSPR